uniref:Uncharacterized protein n=1 Tax=Rhodopseudomonas palustris (strain DX-1) TaxID=652103 RepID=E6VGJ3_RHOPX
MTTILDQIRARREQLAQQREQALANVNYLQGAIALCDELLAAPAADPQKEAEHGQS